MLIVKYHDVVWDDGNRGKCEKHGVSIAEIEALLRQPDLWVAPDVGHSQREKRHLAVGKLQSGRYVFMAFALRGGFVRPISARFMHKKEIRQYEAEIAGNKNG